MLARVEPVDFDHESLFPRGKAFRPAASSAVYNSAMLGGAANMAAQKP